MTARRIALPPIILFVLWGLTLVTGNALAMPPDPLLHQVAPAQGEFSEELGTPQFTGLRADTTWFGGDNGSGLPYLGGVWDFETPGSNGFQGCTSWDLTDSPDVYFYVVTAADFASHGDPCVPMILGTTGMLWCGVHEDEADRMDFVAGMGYMNNMCQRAFSPIFTGFDPYSEAIDLSFTYFNYSEPTFDYSYVYVLCYDAADELIEEYLVAELTGVIGDHQVPAFYDEGIEIPAGTLSAGTVKVQIELRFVADGVWSDEDGLYDSPCGPFAADDVLIAIGGTPHAYDFDDGAQGWTFDKCAGKGAWMHIVHEYEYTEWLDDLGITCDCGLSGDAIGFTAVECANGPGLVPGQSEEFETGPLSRTGYPAPWFNTAIVQHDQFVNFPHSAGAHYRPGWRMYPYTTEVNPAPHWSQRQGQWVWYYTGSPYCHLSTVNLSAMSDSPLPAEWDSVKYTYEIYCSCDAFAIPTSVCADEGCTHGAPVVDNIRIGLTHTPNAPPITLVDGGLFMDGFGQNYPTFLDPGDRCNANVSFDLSFNDTMKNDWHGDTTLVSGPLVTSPASRFLCEMCFKVARLGAWQNVIPEYQAWKARLASNPENDFVCVLMDSLETNNHTQVWNRKFYSYFHENAVGYAGPPDYGSQNEILPDLIWVPGTRLEYYFRSYWYNGGAPPQEYYVLGYPPAREVEFLPTMQIVSPGFIQWPSVLYVDAFNRGASETYMSAALGQAGIAFDKFDYLDNASSFNAPFKRSFGGAGYNPGGYGNNGCTLEQLLGYRVILWSNGAFGVGSCEPQDFSLFDSWLSTTMCGVPNIRRAIVFDGDAICQVMADPTQGLAVNFCHNVLGTRLTASSYATYNEDQASCVYLAPATGASFPVEAAMRGACDGCKANVLGVQAGLLNVVGNVDCWSHELTGNQEYVEFAQVVRQRQEMGVANWRSAVNGFSFHRLTERGGPGAPCPTDSAHIVAGILDVYGPMLEWFAQGATPFDPWTGVCGFFGDTPNETHLSGPVNYLHQSRPNPFNTRAAIRFSLASAGDVEVAIYDVAGRLVKTLIDDQAPAGESSLAWDGTDNAGNRVGAGVFWVQMTTQDGYRSGEKMILMR